MKQVVPAVHCQASNYAMCLFHLQGAVEQLPFARCSLLMLLPHQ